MGGDPERLEKTGMGWGGNAIDFVIFEIHITKREGGDTMGDFGHPLLASGKRSWRFR